MRRGSVNLVCYSYSITADHSVISMRINLFLNWRMFTGITAVLDNHVRVGVLNAGEPYQRIAECCAGQLSQCM